jgi:hypothetical protein
MGLAIGIIFIQLSSEIKSHVKAILACGYMMFEPHLELNLFHKLSIVLLAAFSITQVIYSLILQQMGVYLTFIQTNMLYIFTNTLSVLFINSISTTVGTFMKEWLRDDKTGWLITNVKTINRSEIEFISQMAAYA